MEVEININGNKKPISIKEPKGKHQVEYLKKLLAIDKDPNNLIEFLKYRDELIKELTDLDEKTIENMDLKEKAKITGKIEERFAIIQGEKNFLIPSGKPQN